jgi:hypothetical protein
MVEPWADGAAWADGIVESGGEEVLLLSTQKAVGEPEGGGGRRLQQAGSWEPIGEWEEKECIDGKCKGRMEKSHALHVSA